MIEPPTWYALAGHVEAGHLQVQGAEGVGQVVTVIVRKTRVTQGHHLAEKKGTRQQSMEEKINIVGRSTLVAVRVAAKISRKSWKISRNVKQELI